MLYIESMGKIVPPDIAGWTIDQLLIVLDAPGAHKNFISPDEAVARGLMEPGGKSGVEMALEEQAQKEAAQQAAAIKAKREARRQKRRAALESQAQAAEPPASEHPPSAGQGGP